MKKTLITLLALASMASASETQTLKYNVTLNQAAYDGYLAIASDSTGWVNLSWKNFSAANVQTDLALLGINSEGNYAFNHAGSAENTTYPGISFPDDVLTITGRSGVSQETLFACVVDVATFLGTYSPDALTNLSVTTTVSHTANANGSASDAWWGLYKMDSEGGVTMLFNLCDDSTGSHNDLRGKDQETLTLTTDQLSTISITDKMVLLYRQGCGGASVSVNSISYSATVLVPEPATATLSLLALCGLAARRRRH